jgi:hypothetical protein
MSTARAALAVAAAFVAAQVLAVIVHGVILSADYEPFEGSLLRAAGGDQPPWQMVFLPVAHLVYVSTMVWLYARLHVEGSLVARGVTLGLVSWLMSQVPLWLICAAVARTGERAPAFAPAANRPTYDPRRIGVALAGRLARALVESSYRSRRSPVHGEPRSTIATSVCTKSSPLKRSGSPVEIASAYEKQSP